MRLTGAISLGWLIAISPPDAWSSPAENNAGKPYVDKLISADARIADPDAEDYAPYDESGLARSLRLEASQVLLNRNGKQTSEAGVLVGLKTDTESYGSLSLEGVLRDKGDSLGSFWQRNLPINSEWFANNGLGMINTPAIGLSQQQYRFFIPTMTIMGGSTEWRHVSEDFTALAGMGQPGFYSGIRMPGFKAQPGTVSSVGAQANLGEGLKAGIQLVNASDTSLYYQQSIATHALNAQGALASLLWRDGNTTIHGNLINSDSNLYGQHSGAWLDALWRDDLLDHRAGIFRLEPGLLWGNQYMASNLEGVYYRAAYQRSQWQFDGGFDYAAQVNGSEAGTTFFTANARYQYSRDWGFGGGSNVRIGPHNAWSAFAYLNHRNVLGNTRLQLSHAEDHQRRNEQATLDHAWRTHDGMRLSTSLTLQHEENEGLATDSAIFSIYGSGDLGRNLTLDGNAQWHMRTGDTESRATYLNVGVSWQFMPSWFLSIFAYKNDSTLLWQTLTVDSPIVNPALQEAQKWRDKGIFISLRYDFSAGRRQAPLGGKPGDGAGRVAGIVYYDQNDDRLMNSGETGVPNLTLLLDGKFVSRTDGAGRFDFSQVKAGSHTVQILADNLPLPWRLRDGGRTEFVVEVRETTTLNLGVFKNR